MIVLREVRMILKSEEGCAWLCGEIRIVVLPKSNLSSIAQQNLTAPLVRVIYSQWSFTQKIKSDCPIPIIEKSKIIWVAL